MEQTFAFENSLGETLTLQYVTAVKGLGLIAPEVPTNKIYGVDGVKVGTRSRPGRVFSLAFDIRQRTAAAAIAEREAITQFFADNEPKRFIYTRDGWEVYLYPVYRTGTFETEIDLVRKLSSVMQFLSENPHLKIDIPITSVATETAALEWPDPDGLEFPYVDDAEVGIEYSTAEQEISITSDAQIISPAFVRFVGPANAPYITNETTGETLALRADAVVDSGEILEIDGDAGTIEIIDDEGERHNAFNYIDDDSDFINLAPGENLIAFGTSGGAVGYIEVGGWEYYEGI